MKTGQARRFAHAVNKTGKVVMECFGPPNARLEGDSLSAAIYKLSETLIRGNFPEKRGGFFGGDFGYGADYENDVFLLHPDFQDASCSCGFEERYEGVREPHQENCARSIIDAKLNAWPETPHVELTIRWGLRNRLEARVRAALGVSSRWDCNCGVTARLEAWLEKNDHADRCSLHLPNFWYKPTDFKVDWYKYIGREMESTSPLKPEAFRAMFNACLDSIPIATKNRAAADARKEAKKKSAISPGRRRAINRASFAALARVNDLHIACWKCSKSKDFMIPGTTHSGPHGKVSLTLRDEHGKCLNCKTATNPLQGRILSAIQDRNRPTFSRSLTIGEKLPQ